MPKNLIYQIEEDHHRIHCDCGCSTYFDVYDHYDDMVEILVYHDKPRGLFRRIWDAFTNEPIMIADIVFDRNQAQQLANLFQQIANKE